MRISDLSSDVCSSDLIGLDALARLARQRGQQVRGDRLDRDLLFDVRLDVRQALRIALAGEADRIALGAQPRGAADAVHVILGIERQVVVVDRSEEHTSELQSLMRISYAVFGLKKNN